MTNPSCRWQWTPTVPVPAEPPSTPRPEDHQLLSIRRCKDHPSVVPDPGGKQRSLPMVTSKHWPKPGEHRGDLYTAPACRAGPDAQWLVCCREGNRTNPSITDWFPPNSGICQLFQAPLSLKNSDQASPSPILLKLVRQSTLQFCQWE